jgi:uncharacterized protein (DUF697 family)
MIGRVLRVVRTARPYAEAIAEAHDVSSEQGGLALADGAPALTRRLEEVLGLVSSRVARPLDELLVIGVGPGDDADAAGATLAERKRRGGRGLAVLVGSTRDRRAAERAVLAHEPLELDDVAQVAALDARGARDLLFQIASRFAESGEAVAAGRRHPALRPIVTEHIVRRSARRAALVAALPVSGSDYLVLATMQIGMIGGVNAMHGRERDAQTMTEAVAVLGAGAGWRALAHGAGGLVPDLRPAVKAGIAYSTTRALGELARARIAGGRTLAGRLPAPARDAADRVIQRLPAPFGAGAHEGSSG